MDSIRDPDYEITNIAKEQIRIREEAGKCFKEVTICYLISGILL